MKKNLGIGIGKRIQEIRTFLGIQQNDMADAVGMNPTYLSELENGLKENPTIGTLYKITSHYNISLDYLLHGTGDMFLPSEGSKPKEEQFLTPDFTNIDFVTWLMRKSNFAKNNILGFIERFYFENEDFIKKNMQRLEGKGKEETMAPAGEETPDEKGGDKG